MSARGAQVGGESQASGKLAMTATPALKIEGVLRVGLSDGPEHARSSGQCPA